MVRSGLAQVRLARVGFGEVREQEAMKVHGSEVQRCALCGSWPTAVSEIGEGGQSWCQCIRCEHKSMAVETGKDVSASVLAAIEAWNVEMSKQ